MVNAVLRLHFDEPVRLDRGQLEVLYRNLGPTGADRVVAHALEDLATALTQASAQYGAGEIEALRGTVKSVIALAQQVGMTVLARVGRDVLALSHSYDAAAFGATMARLGRIGEGSLVAVWDLQDLSG
ncbi:hypothetical protein [Sinisalibacter aestuarii]|uniref:Uncharacterized protein n=1 Tax=Sinisalibacter aestuarii TaxID=2949426 RepID=A0ABQ5LPE0_9RHOB|nr:hypothetical protein [Sinisalibacter aestuarii]GKY86275.1 hypothetical protein STA1M1_01440 [Sinisalibacter aestuarii]